MTFHARTLRLSGILLAVAVAGSPALAAEKTVTVKFKAGSSSATLNGAVKGYDGITYVLGAAAGQQMAVKLKPSNEACYFNVTPPGSDTAIFIGSTDGNEFSGTLSVAGNYRVLIYLMRSAARRNETCNFTVSFAISGGSGKAAAAPADSAAQPAACVATAANLYGIDASKVTLDNEGNLSPTAEGFSMTGNADKGSEGMKQFECKFDRQKKLVDVMPLNSDGE